MADVLNNLLFIFQRLTWLSLVDIALVTFIFFGLMYWLRDTQAMVLLRGVILIVVALILLTSLLDLPAFSWLVRNSVPAMLLAIPVIFAPEIRRALERIGRAGTLLPRWSAGAHAEIEQSVRAVVTAAARLSARQHGALIIMQRLDNLDEFIESGVRMNAIVTPEVLLQVFYPNTPLHDGATIISGNRIVAAACVMPLSSSGILNRSPERQMGLRHRAALGISEESDAVAVVVSEETGAISIAHAGRMIRRIDPDRLENILLAFFRPSAMERTTRWYVRMFPFLFPRKEERNAK
ncbi:MAG TPA: diadenylate cyclase CdaA [Anaerolineales bacterium]|nr:diadenylate cyclase CdaA [Anaerolineales bacterium]